MKNDFNCSSESEWLFGILDKKLSMNLPNIVTYKLDMDLKDELDLPPDFDLFNYR